MPDEKEKTVEAEELHPDGAGQSAIKKPTIQPAGTSEAAPWQDSLLAQEYEH